mmetsp:Transcript_85716/g.239603  ORF Transcript_85716/g.239603 Transcript_85716/m.239603 type:complete len:264 (-) Transcript_85716:1014-1805(-)
MYPVHCPRIVRHILEARIGHAHKKRQPLPTDGRRVGAVVVAHPILLAVGVLLQVLDGLLQGATPCWPRHVLVRLPAHAVILRVKHGRALQQEALFLPGPVHHGIARVRAHALLPALRRRPNSAVQDDLLGARHLALHHLPVVISLARLGLPSPVEALFAVPLLAKVLGHDAQLQEAMQVHQGIGDASHTLSLLWHLAARRYLLFEAAREDAAEVVYNFEADVLPAEVVGQGQLVHKVPGRMVAILRSSTLAWLGVVPPLEPSG